MLFRKLQETDYEKYLILINDFRSSSFTQDQFISTLSYINNFGEVWLLFDDNSDLIATATILFEKKLLFNTCTCAHIENVCVKKEQRRFGYGKQIIHKLIQRAKEEKCYKITLNCGEENIKFYEACGFKKRGVEMCELTENL